MLYRPFFSIFPILFGKTFVPSTVASICYLNDLVVIRDCIYDFDMYRVSAHPLRKCPSFSLITSASQCPRVYKVARVALLYYRAISTDYKRLCAHMVYQISNPDDIVSLETTTEKKYEDD